jgi:hypothetical protein
MESSGTRPSEGEPPVPERADARRRAAEPNRTAQARARPRWIPDAEAERCMLCNPDWRFGPLPGYRRHHCRSCGWVVCAACIPDSQTLELDRWVSSTAGNTLKDGDPTKPKRVCNSCAEHAPAEVEARLRARAAAAAAEPEPEPEPVPEPADEPEDEPLAEPEPDAGRRALPEGKRWHFFVCHHQVRAATSSQFLAACGTKTISCCCMGPTN